MGTDTAKRTAHAIRMTEPTEPQSHYMQQIDQARNRARRYEAHLLPLPGGGWRLLRRWGRIGARLAERATDYGPEAAGDAAKALGRLLRQKARRGYVPADVGHLRAKKRPPGAEAWGQLLIPWG